MSTDYKSYAVIYNCKQVAPNDMEERFWILGRKNQMSAQQLHAIEAKVHQILPHYDIQKNTLVSDQSNCGNYTNTPQSFKMALLLL